MASPCQICGSDRIGDYVRHDEGHYLRCADCGLVFNADADELVAAAEARYDEADYFAGYASRFEAKVRAARRRLDLVRSFATEGRLLDIGTGMGEALVAAQEAGFEPVGLDVGAYPVERARELGFEAHQASITDTGLPDESVDVVTMWDVIEHIPRTIEGLAEVSRILKPGGIAAMMAPSGEYLKAHLLRQTYQNYQGLWAKTHFVYHNPRTLRKVLADVGLQALRCPVLRRGALARGLPEAMAEVLIALPRYVVWHARANCRIIRNVFIVARKQA